MEMYRYQVDRGIERISKLPYCIYWVNQGILNLESLLSIFFMSFYRIIKNVAAISMPAKAAAAAHFH